MPKKILTIAVIIWCFVTSSDAQTNEGTEFWFGFMEHLDVGDNVKVAMITSKFNTSGTVNIPNRNWSINFTVAADQVTIVTLPNYTENVGSESFDNTGIQLLSDAPVSVYLHQYHEFRSEAAVVLPVNSLGSSYFTMTYKGVENRGTEYPAEFLVVGVEDETSIKITVSDATEGGLPKGAVINIMLDKGETYQVQGARASSDLSGSFLEGDQNFVVFSGNTWTEVPTGCQARDNLMEQMYGLDTWGRKIVTVPSANATYDIFRIMAAEDNTTVNVSGRSGAMETIQLNRGEFSEKRFSEAKFIEADKPIQVGQFLVGQGCSGHRIGDPSMVILNSVVQTRDTVTLFNSALQNIQENYINIIAKTTDVPLITLDGAPIPASAEIEEVGTDGFYSFARISVAAGAHTIVSDGCGVIATAYGYGDAESYAYSGGASFNSINANPIVDGGCLNDTVFFNANLPEERYSFLWDLGGGEIYTTASFEKFYDELGSYPVDLIITDECVGTMDTFAKEILISLRQAVDAVGDTTICAEQSFSLGASDVSAATYEWTGPNGFFSEEQFLTIDNATIVMGGQYEVIGIVSGCATFPSFSQVDVLSLPEPDFEQDSVYCNLRDEVILFPGQFFSYLWQDNSESEDIVVSTEGVYSVTVTDSNGCEEELSILMREQCPTEIYMPNVFSPNGDGVNDAWQVLGHDITSIDLEVRNRWGEIVFVSEDPNEVWTGEHLGKPVVTDVYMYKLEVEGFTETGQIYKETLFGTVTVIR